MKYTAKYDLKNWQKRMDDLLPQLREKVAKTALKTGDEARGMLTQNLSGETGDMVSTIFSGHGQKGLDEYFSYIGFGNDDNPASPFEHGHIDAKSGVHVKPARVFYPIIKVINRKHTRRIVSSQRRILNQTFKK